MRRRPWAPGDRVTVDYSDEGGGVRRHGQQRRRERRGVRRLRRRQLGNPKNARGARTDGVAARQVAAEKAERGEAARAHPIETRRLCTSWIG